MHDSATCNYIYITIHSHPIDWIHAFSLHGTWYLNHLTDFHNQCTLLYLVANLHYTYTLAYYSIVATLTNNIITKAGVLIWCYGTTVVPEQHTEC